MQCHCHLHENAQCALQALSCWTPEEGGRWVVRLSVASSCYVVERTAAREPSIVRAPEYPAIDLVGCHGKVRVKVECDGQVRPSAVVCVCRARV